MTKLRQQMDDDMLARGRADRTRESYLEAVTGLARFYRRSPDARGVAPIDDVPAGIISPRPWPIAHRREPEAQSLKPCV